jgi:hypothetical protein
VLGGAIIGFGLTASILRSAWPALGCLVLAGSSDFVSGIYRTAMLAGLTPDELRGRLEGISLAVVATGPSLGNLEAGAVASIAGVPFSIVSGGVLCIAGAAALAFLVPDYRRYRAEPLSRKRDLPADI